MGSHTDPAWLLNAQRYTRGGIEDSGGLGAYGVVQLFRMLRRKFVWHPRWYLRNPSKLVWYFILVKPMCNRLTVCAFWRCR